ncbi:MAG: hypothetical protein OQJ89_04755 [Kangiellaceae bacterium]|nr:hypothetical protein [Kangiellaceae bacterium]MCW9016253.1 hypothetical protein [Kangiellaceae bacterium]
MKLPHFISLLVLFAACFLVSLYLTIFAEITAFRIFVVFPALFLTMFATFGYLIESRNGFMVSKENRTKVKELDERNLTQNESTCSFAIKFRTDSNKVA